MSSFGSVIAYDDLILQNDQDRVAITVVDDNGAPIDVNLGSSGVLKLSVRTPWNTQLISDDFSVIGTRIIRTGVGQYYFPFGALNPNKETNRPGTFIFKWTVQVDGNSRPQGPAQLVKVISCHSLILLKDLRMLIDKAKMCVNEDPLNPSVVGYTDFFLVSLLDDGLTIINAAQPYPTFCSLDAYPLIFKRVLLDAALLTGIMSQQLFAIATDIPNYSDQGNSFVLDHQPRLANYCAQVRDDLKTSIPALKLHFVNTGSVKIEAGANYRLAQLLAAAPSGATFRNFFGVL